MRNTCAEVEDGRDVGRLVRGEEGGRAVVTRVLGADRKGGGDGSESGCGRGEVRESESMTSVTYLRRGTSGVRWTSATECYSGSTRDREQPAGVQTVSRRSSVLQGERKLLNGREKGGETTGRGCRL